MASISYKVVSTVEDDCSPGPDTAIESGEFALAEEEDADTTATASLARTTRTKRVFAVSGYMGVSASLLVVNKLAVSHVPLPSVILFLQLASASAFTWAAGRMQFIEVDALDWETTKRFWIVPAVFLLTVYSNIKVLQFSNVETFIVFRASAPLALSVLDAVFLNRDLPSKRSTACLVGIFLSGLGYLVFESAQFTVNSVFWAVTWYVVFCVNQIYIKHIVDNVDMSTWGRVFYTNLLPLAPLVLINALTGEAWQVAEAVSEASRIGLLWLLASCVFGTLMSYFAFAAREVVSATAFSVVGDACKALTIIINVLMWDKHATFPGILSLLACLGFSFLYEQSPVIVDQEDKRRVRNRLRVIFRWVGPLGLLGAMSLPALSRVLSLTLVLHTSAQSRFAFPAPFAEPPSWVLELVETGSTDEGHLSLSRIQRVRTSVDKTAERPVVSSAVVPMIDSQFGNVSFGVVYRRVETAAWEQYLTDGQFRGSELFLEPLDAAFNSNGVAPHALGPGLNPCAVVHQGELWSLVQAQSSQALAGYGQSDGGRKPDGRYLVSSSGEKVQLDGEVGGSACGPFSMDATLFFVESFWPLRIARVDSMRSGATSDFFQQRLDPWESSRAVASADLASFEPTTAGQVVADRYVVGLGHLKSGGPRKGNPCAVVWTIDMERLELGVSVEEIYLAKPSKLLLPTSLFVSHGAVFVAGVETDKAVGSTDLLHSRKPFKAHRAYLYTLAPDPKRPRSL